MQNGALTHTVTTKIALHVHADTEAFTKSRMWSQDHLIKQRLLYSMPGKTNKIKSSAFSQQKLARNVVINISITVSERILWKY